MWIFTESGFVSAVVNRENPDTLIVRSRDLPSIEPLAATTNTKVITGAGADYPHRIVCSRDQFTQWANDAIEAMSYGNFKSRVIQTRGHNFSDALMDVWSVMHNVEDVVR